MFTHTSFQISARFLLGLPGFSPQMSLPRHQWFHDSREKCRICQQFFIYLFIFTFYRGPSRPCRIQQLMQECGEMLKNIQQIGRQKLQRAHLPNTRAMQKCHRFMFRREKAFVQAETRSSVVLFPVCVCAQARCPSVCSWSLWQRQCVLCGWWLSVASVVGVNASW